MKKLLSIFFAATAIGAAAINPDEFPVLELGKDYAMQAYGEFKGRIIAPESGIMIEYGTVPVYTLDENNELQDLGDENWQYAGYINGRQAYQFHVTAGTTYYAYDSFVMDACTVRFEMNPKVEIMECFPKEGTVYDVADEEFITIILNQNITIGTATLSCGDLAETILTRANGSNISLLVRDVMIKWYDEKKVIGGETLTVTLSDLKDSANNDIDPIVLNFIAAGEPYVLLSSKLPDVIVSYMPESGEATKAVFTFSGPMAPNPNIQLCYSPIELGYEYYEQMDAVVEGNTITVDFSGKLRVAEQMSAEGRKYNSFDLRLFALRDARGQLILAGEGMKGSFHLQVPFYEIPRMEINAQFTPENGTYLTDDDKDVTIYFNNAKDIQYSGVQFSSHGETVVVNKDEITVTPVSDNEVELTVAIPAGWVGKKDLYVSLADVATPDGYDHSAELAAKYNGFTLTFVNPSDGTKLASLAQGRTITVDSNLESGTALMYSVTADGETIYGPVAMTERTPGSYVHAMQKEVVLYAGVDYELIFSVGASKEIVKVIGTSAEYEYSPNEFVGIDPAEGTKLEGNSVITVSFSGLVDLYPMPESVGFTATHCSDFETFEGYDNTWALTLDKVTGNVTVAFRALDMDFKTVKGNVGNEDQSYFLFRYNTESGIMEVENVNSGVEAVYDLHGRRLTAPVRGVNIINGRKVLK